MWWPCCLPAGMTATRRSGAVTDPKSVFILPASVVQIAMGVPIYKVKDTE